jgi:KaiC/GvpD/RAD55 family RecA-like ATPase
VKGVEPFQLGGLTMGTEHVKTYIDGFDDKLQGGIPAGSVVLLVGQPGTMKSSVAFNMLFNNAKDKGLRSLYVTLEQGSKSLTNHMTAMGMNQKEVFDKLEIIDIGLIRKKLTQLQDQSWVQVFNVLAKFDNPREELFHLFEWLRDLNVTTILITEMTPDTAKFAHHGEDFLADGIIYLRMAEIGDISVQRQIRCVKMRAVNHNGDYHSLLFDGGRFKATKSIAQTR